MRFIAGFSRHPFRCGRWLPPNGSFRPIAAISDLRQLARMFASLLMAVALATGRPASACPVQPEPAALTSAAFTIPSRGETLLFSAAPSFQSVRYALRVVRPSASRRAFANLLRLKRRFDCNVHDRVGEWKFELSPDEGDSLFSASAALEDRNNKQPEVVLDGTSVELRHYVDGKLAFVYGSNEPAKEQLSETVLNVLARHVPRKELPASDDWRYKLPGTKI